MVGLRAKALDIFGICLEKSSSCRHSGRARVPRLGAFCRKSAGIPAVKAGFEVDGRALPAMITGPIEGE
jgi:hypothetical protein